MSINQFSRTSVQSQLNSKRLPYLLIALISCIGGILILYVTQWGIGISPDSTVYISVARNLLKGYGFSVSPGTPLTHYPPLYPLILSLGGIGGQDILNGARLIHILLFIATLACAGLIIYRETGGSLIASISGILLLLCSKNVIFVYSFAWSESLFILLSIAGLWLLGKYLETSKSIILICSSTLICFAFLTRYIGISLVLTGFLFILLFSTLGLFRRAIIAAVFSTISLIPISLWILRNRLTANTLTNRSFTAHPITWQHVHDTILTISNWFLVPQSWSIVLKADVIAVLTIAVLTAYILLFKLTLKTSGNRQILYSPSIFILFIFSYFLSLGFSISCVDAHTPLDDRILTPLYILGIIALVCVAYHLWLYRGKRKAAAVLLLLVSFSFLTAQANYTIPFVVSSHSEGNGYSHKDWKTSPIIKAVKSFPDNLVIFSNGSDAIEILTGKTSQMIPRKVNTDTNLNNENFESQFQDMIKEIENGKAILIYFSNVDWRWYLPSEEEIAGHLHAGVLYKNWDGTVWGSKQ